MKRPSITGSSYKKNIGLFKKGHIQKGDERGEEVLFELWGADSDNWAVNIVLDLRQVKKEFCKMNTVSESGQSHEYDCITDWFREN